LTIAVPELGRRLIRVKQGLALRERDPLALWHHSSEQSREATALTNEVDEIHARAANKGGKTEWEYAVGLAILQKRPSLDGVPLPQWRGRVEGVSLELDHEQQKLSSQQTILRLLGKWPHHAKHVGDALKTLRIMPVSGDADESRWSTLTFMSQKNMSTGKGIRADLVLGNEPPREDIWREMRKAAHAGRRIVRIIGETPTKRREWSWIKDDYGDCPRDSIRRQQNRAEVRWSLHHNTALSADETKALLAEYWGDPSREYPADPLYDARVFGDYIDTTGLCPFDIVALNHMLEECIPPSERQWTITREVDGDDGRVKAQTKVLISVLKDPEPGKSYYLDVDPSKGINDRSHDPGGILVSEMGSGEDVAMYEGYVGSYGLGSLAAGLARQYNNSLVDPESNSGWAEGVMRGLGDAGYGNIARTRKMGTEGRWETLWGFATTDVTRPAMIEEIQSWAAAYASGIHYAPCRFRRIIETLLDVILDENGKPVASPGQHDEFMILKGQSLRKTVARRLDQNLARPARLLPAKPKAEQTLDDLIKRAVNGHVRIGGGEIPTPRSRPRG
jgi:hypothetical protein